MRDVVQVNHPNLGNLIFPDAAAGAWQLGEQILGLPNGVRDMRNPVVATYQNYNISQPNQDAGGVHTNSGILNLAAVLLCDGQPGAQAGIGRSRLARLAWEVLTLRLHPWASFSDVLHVTWGLALELAASRSLGAAGIAGAPGLPPAFDETIPAAVAWAFQQVGINLDVQSGWVDVTVDTPFTDQPNGGFVADVTLYPGMRLQGGRTLADMEVRLFRKNQLNGSLFATGNVGFNAADGSFSATITSVQLNTDNLETVVRITSPTALTVQATGVPTFQEPPGPQVPVDEPPVNPQDTPVVRHWNDFGLGGRFDERIFEGQQLTEGCFVANVELLLVEADESVLQSTTLVGERLGDESRGCYLITRTLGGRSLELEVHSWFQAGNIVRYKLRYQVAGNNCGLPDFTVTDITPPPQSPFP